MTSDDVTTAEARRDAAAGTTPTRRALVQVLLVEDADRDARLIEEALREDDFQDVALDRVRTLQDALAQATEGVHDVVLLDLGLPDADGLETLRRFRDAAPRLPVVVLTGDARPELGIEAMREGAEEYLVKDSALDGRLARTIRHALHRGRVTDDARVAHVRWRTFVDSAPGTIIATDAHGTIVYINEHGDDVLRPLVGHKVLECIDPDHRSHYRSVVDEVNATGESRSVEVPVELPGSGIRAWCRLRIGPIVERGRRAGYLILAEDITATRRDRLRLEAFRTALDEGHDAVYVVDLETDRFVEANATASRMLGYTQDELLAMGPTDIDLVLHEEGATRAVQDVVDREGAHVFESAHRKADGATVPVEVSLRGLVQGGRPLMVAIVRDITVRKEAEATLAAQRREVQELQAFRNQLLSTVVHDLAQPLSPLLLESELLERLLSKDPERAVRASRVIRRNAHQVDRLVRDLKELARVERGSFRVDMAPVDLAAVAREAVESYDEEARRRGVAIVVTASGPARVLGDRQRLDQVLYNMITNAVKFSDAGGTVHVVTESMDDAVACRVVDEGRGLTEDEVERVFEPFIQVHAPHETEVRGMGLGLYIARTIVERHGGAVWAESEGLGKGATFGFRLPLSENGQKP